MLNKVSVEGLYKKVFQNKVMTIVAESNSSNVFLVVSNWVEPKKFHPAVDAFQNGLITHFLGYCCPFVND